jgi:hypothetical protein
LMTAGALAFGKERDTAFVGGIPRVTVELE